MSDSDEEPSLPADTLAILNQFRNDILQESVERAFDSNDWHTQFRENWQLSQFWYDQHTVDVITDEIIKVTEDDAKVALISCPTLYPDLKHKCSTRKVVLFEFDERFAVLGTDFHKYDYNCPLDLPESYSQMFDMVVVDPPFLSEECLTKTATTVKLLALSKIILCTGSIMEDLAKSLLSVEKTPFNPRHKNNLANEFSCFTNYNHNFK